LAYLINRVDTCQFLSKSKTNNDTSHKYPRILMYLIPLTVVPLGYEQRPKEQPTINISPFTRHMPGIADLAVYERMPNHRGRKSVEHPNIIPQGQRAQVTGSGQKPKYSQTSGTITERPRRNNHALGHFNFLYTHIQTRSGPTWLQLTSH
jgi:hypothetical protein